MKKSPEQIAHDIFVLLHKEGDFYEAYNRITTAIQNERAKVERLEVALKFAVRKCEDIEGDPCMNESPKKIRQQDIEWAGEVIKASKEALKGLVTNDN